jgi:hypothetical protein
MTGNAWPEAWPTKHRWCLLYCAGRRWADDQSRALPQGESGGCSATDATWSLPSLRTDSVNRGFCISLLILAIVVLANFLGLFLFFFFIPPY